MEPVIKKAASKAIKPLVLYSSATDTVATDEDAMFVPICEKAITRGYNIQENLLIRKGKLLFASRLTTFIKNSGIFMVQPKLSQADIINKIREMSKVTDPPVTDANVLLMATGGIGDMSIAVNPANASFYIMLYQHTDNAYLSAKVFESAFNKSQVKSNNYLKGSYIATKSKVQGGYIGIIVDQNDNLLEGSMSTVAVVLKSGEFVVPPPERILAGTTLSKAFEILDKKGQHLVTKVSRRDIQMSEIYEEGKEVFHLGGEECVPIIELDGYKMERGPVGRLLQEGLSELM